MKRDYARLLTDKYIMLMLGVFPLFTGFSGYANITFSKFMFFTIATSVWLVLTVVSAIISKYNWQPKTHQLIALVFAFIATISSLLSDYASVTLLGASRYDGLISTLLYVAIFIGVSEFGQFRTVYIKIASLALLICCVVSLMQMFGSTILFPNGYTYQDAGVLYISKFLGTIGNTNLLAGYLCLIIPLICTFFVLDDNKFVWLLPISAMGFFVLIASESSGGTLAICLGSLLASIIFSRNNLIHRAIIVLAVLAISTAFAMIYLNRYKLAALIAILSAIFFVLSYIFKHKIAKKFHFKIVISSVSICALIGLFAVYFWQGDGGAVYELSQILHGNFSDEFGSSRILIWRECLGIVPENLWLGGGADTLALRIDLEFSRYFEAYEKTMTTSVDNAHNLYIAHLVNFGILGLCAYLSLMAHSLILIFKNKEKHVICLTITLVCAWIENFFGLALCLVSPMMWVLWGLLYTDEETIHIDVTDIYIEGDEF